MGKRYAYIWLRYLATDWFTVQHKDWAGIPFVLAAPLHGRMVVTVANALAQSKGLYSGMVVADARAIYPALKVVDDIPELPQKLLKKIAEWCIRFTPIAAVDLPDGIVMDVTGCAHLWGDELRYINDIKHRLNLKGYYAKIALASNVGSAFGFAKFSDRSVVQCDEEYELLQKLPVAALRIEVDTVERLHKLGLRQISNISSMPAAALKRRFGEQIFTRLQQALGVASEYIEPVIIPEPYEERLPCMEPISTAVGIEIALKRLLQTLCDRLMKEQKGLRQSTFKCYRCDGKIEQISIATGSPSYHLTHLFKLFETKISTIEPALGIELFKLTASQVEDHIAEQQNLWQPQWELDNLQLSELLDRLSAKVGDKVICRYLPAEHYWPERSIKKTSSLTEQKATEWKVDRPRPIQLLSPPELIKVTAPVPDYPPMNFRYKGVLHKVAKADGPERIEQEWWLQDGKHRDYYVVEDDKGYRYWIFRSGHFTEDYEWFIHGFFA